MADFGAPLSYHSDSQSRHEEGGIISLPDMSDTNSVKRKRKLSNSSGKKKAKKSKTNIYTKKNNELVKIEEAESAALEVTQNFSKKSNIKVAVRLRPLGDKEIEEDQFEIVNILDK